MTPWYKNPVFPSYLLWFFSDSVGDYYKMEDEKEKSTHIAAGGTKHESAFWDEIDSKQ